MSFFLENFELWFLVALIPPFLYAFINHLDKIILDRYFKEGGVGTLLIYSTIFTFFTIPYAVVNDPAVFDAEWYNILIMVVVGVLNVGLLWSYLKALEKDETTIVILYYQLLPVFGLVLGYLFLGETITATQLWAMIIIIFGTTLASFEISDLKDIRFRWRTCGYMMIAVTCWAGESTIGKIFILNENVYRSIFWESVVMIGLGLILFFGFRTYREHFLDSFRQNSKGIIGLNLFNEATYQVGNAATSHALKLALVFLVLMMQPLQAIFVFIIGVFLTLVIPKIYKENLDPINVTQKLLALAITTYGILQLEIFKADATLLSGLF